MSIFQIGAVCFALFMIYLVRTYRSRAGLSKLELYFWYVVWTVFGVISVFPQLLLGIAGILRFQRVFDLLVVIAFMIISIVSLVNYFQNKVTQKTLETLVRKLALDNTELAAQKENKDAKKKK